MLNRRLLLNDVRTMLSTATARPVGLTVVPGTTDTPYCILYPIDTRLYGPPFGGSEEDADVEIQATSVGEGTEQAEWMADRVRLAILGRAGPERGFVNVLPSYIHSRSSSGGPGAVDLEGIVVSVAERFVFHMAQV